MFNFDLWWLKEFYPIKQLPQKSTFFAQKSYQVLHYAILGKISVQPHTLIMHTAISYCHYTLTAIMKRASKSENCMHN